MGVENVTQMLGAGFTTLGHVSAQGTVHRAQGTGNREQGTGNSAQGITSCLGLYDMKNVTQSLVWGFWYWAVRVPGGWTLQG